MKNVIKNGTILSFYDDSMKNGEFYSERKGIILSYDEPNYSIITSNGNVRDFNEDNLVVMVENPEIGEKAKNALELCYQAHLKEMEIYSQISDLENKLDKQNKRLDTVEKLLEDAFSEINSNLLISYFNQLVQNGRIKIASNEFIELKEWNDGKDFDNRFAIQLTYKKCIKKYIQEDDFPFITIRTDYDKNNFGIKLVSIEDSSIMSDSYKDEMDNHAREFFTSKAITDLPKKNLIVDNKDNSLYYVSENLVTFNSKMTISELENYVDSILVK